MPDSRRQLFRLVTTLGLNLAFVVSIAAGLLGQQKHRALSVESTSWTPLFSLDSCGWRILDGPPIGREFSFHVYSFPNQPEQWDQFASQPRWTSVLPGVYWCDEENHSQINVRHSTWIAMLSACMLIHHRRLIARAIRRRPAA